MDRIHYCLHHWKITKRERRKGKVQQTNKFLSRMAELVEIAKDNLKKMPTLEREVKSSRSDMILTSFENFTVII